MKASRRKELILSVVFKSLIIIGAIVGVITSFVFSRLTIKKNEILYYTIQSNIWIFGIMVTMLVFDIICLVKKKEIKVPQWVMLIKYIFTVAITLTGLVYNFVLYPGSLTTKDPANPLAIENFCTHIFVPIMSILDFILFDYRLKSNKWTFFWGISTPLYYFVFALIAAPLGAKFLKDSKFPYFFLDYETLTWFGFNGAPGTFYWILFVLGIVLGISSILLVFKGKRKQRKDCQKFHEFRLNYQFDYKRLTAKEDGIYFDDICVEDCDGKKTFEGEGFINTSYGSKASIARVLSNLYPQKFKFRGKKVESIEGVLQGVKYKDKKIQNAILKYSGLDAYHTRACNTQDFWGNDGLLYWKGRPMRRNSEEYQEFLDELYFSASFSPVYKKALLSTGDKYLLHHIGNEDKNQTVLTRYEYEERMMALREFLRSEESEENLK